MSNPIVQFPASYIDKIAMCLKAHSINLGKPHSVKAAQNYLEHISAELLSALENVKAAKSDTPDLDTGITVSWCEGNMAFAVERDGSTVECFPTRKEAMTYANELAQGIVDEKASAASA